MPADDGVLRRGSSGSLVSRLQQNLNTVLHAGLAVDGDFGPATEAALRAFQARFGLEQDGEYGPQSAAMMRAALAGRPAIPTPDAPGTGRWRTARGRRRLRTGNLRRPATRPQRARRRARVDGSLGPQTARALQKFLGAAVDGRVGPQTIRALQRHVGAAEDGTWGPDTTSHLQRALNAGTF